MRMGFTLVFLLLSGVALGQSVSPDSSASVIPDFVGRSLDGRRTRDERVREYLLPARILWTSESGVAGSDRLLQPVLGQTSTADMNSGCVLEKKGEEPCALLLDFGREFQGGIRLESRDLGPVAGSVGKSVRVRVRFGESADEAMAEPGEKGAISEHSTRDMIVNVPWLGAVEFGESAFRFARLDLVDPGARIVFDSVRAVMAYRNLPWLGSFRSSDERLNAIWQTAAWTQFLTMQGYIFEGAKRDRLVWYGDFHPQAMTTLALFGAVPVLTDTVGTYARSTWPLPKWMNGMANYSLWWIITLGDLYQYSGDLAFLREQWDYVRGLTDQLLPCIHDNGQGAFDYPFLDWPTADNRPALEAGTHAMFLIAFNRLRTMAQSMADEVTVQKATEALSRLETYHPRNLGNKQAAALMACAGLEKGEGDAESNSDVVARDGGRNFSTFYGYYMLEALARADRKQEALDIIRQYWGAMIDVGATTFWEDFDLDWLAGAGRIDERTPAGLESLHGDRGRYCYAGFRHSLCHGWSSGPVPWLAANVLGVEPLEPGFRRVRFTPFLGDLDWAEGTIPTPYGVIRVRLQKNADGSLNKTIEAPPEIQVGESRP